ncbi:lysophospholipase L1-like esterase [Sphingomonas sp. UYAg733]
MKFTPAFLAAVLVCASAQAQEAARAPDPVEERIHNDWPELGRYRSANAALKPTPGRSRIVFIGDSITDWWLGADRAFFTPGRIDRGIGGQTTPQMVVRFRQDVIDLKPDVVQIMAGTNDIGGNTGPMTAEQTQDNFKTMVELAQAHGIRVIIGSILPSDRFPWKPAMETGTRIMKLNAWLKAYAASTGSVYADYWAVLKGDGLGMRDGMTGDGVHPTAEGYRAMAPVAEAAIKAALASAAPKPLRAAE